MKTLLTTGVAAISLAALLAACGDTANTNVRSNNGVTNLGANNANVGAIVVNANANANTGSNSNRWTNANSVTREQYDRDRAEYERDKGSSTIGTGANDSWIWFKTRAALMATDDLRDSTINVDVSNAVITLKGSVATPAERTKAETVANGIEGKSKVVNQLTVAAKDSVTNMSSNGNRTNSNR